MSNILIVGANQGIGYYMVKRLLEKGSTVTVLDIQEEHISELKNLTNDIVGKNGWEMTRKIYERTKITSTEREMKDFYKHVENWH